MNSFIYLFFWMKTHLYQVDPPVAQATSLTELVQRKKAKNNKKLPAWHISLKCMYARSAVPVLYRPYKGLMGALELPVSSIEIQAAEYIERNKAKVNGTAYQYRPPIMKFVKEATTQCIIDEDHALRMLDDTPHLPMRIHEDCQLKFGMHHNGTDGDYKERKKTSVKVGTAYFHLCEATPLLAFIAEVRKMPKGGDKLDDLFDSFNLGMADARKKYTMAARAYHPFLRVDKLGALIPGGVSVIDLGVDPGTANYARCIVQVNELLPERKHLKLYLPVVEADDVRREEAADEEGEEDDEQESVIIAKALPVFRILLWELLNLKTNTVIAHFAADDDSPYYKPGNRDIADMFVEQAVKTKKRKAEVEGDQPVQKKQKLETEPLEVVEQIAKTKKRKAVSEEEEDQPAQKKQKLEVAPVVKPTVLIDMVDSEDF